MDQMSSMMDSTWVVMALMAGVIVLTLGVLVGVRVMSAREDNR